MYGVDLTESFHMSIYLQKLASIQPRTSLLKFEGGGFSAPVILSFRGEAPFSRLDSTFDWILFFGLRFVPPPMSHRWPPLRPATYES